MVDREVRLLVSFDPSDSFSRTALETDTSCLPPLPAAEPSVELTTPQLYRLCKLGSHVHFTFQVNGAGSFSFCSSEIPDHGHLVTVLQDAAALVPSEGNTPQITAQMTSCNAEGEPLSLRTRSSVRRVLYHWMREAHFSVGTTREAEAEPVSVAAWYQVRDLDLVLMRGGKGGSKTKARRARKILKKLRVLRARASFEPLCGENEKLMGVAEGLAAEGRMDILRAMYDGLAS